MNTVRAIVGGFSDDITGLASAIPEVGRCFIVNEDTSYDTSLPHVDLVIYAFSKDTGYSSRLLSWFSWINYNMRPKREYIVPVPPLKHVDVVFHFAQNLPFATIAEATKMLQSVDDERNGIQE